MSRRDHDLPRKLKSHPRRLTRRSVLMEMVAGGDVANARCALETGAADPNQYVGDTGRAALSEALDRAQETGDTAPLYLLLEWPLLPETVSRPFAPFGEVPLTLAIDIAESRAVARLIELGAQTERLPGRAPTALAHALSVFAMVHTARGWAEATVRYTRAEHGADVYDAAFGVTTDTAAARWRASEVARILSDPEKRRVQERQRARIARPATDYRAVIRTLLEKGANPNTRYAGPLGGHDRWTPTLLAAQVGDLEILDLLVGAGGQLDQCLYPPGRGPHIDALAIARYAQHCDVVRWLERQRR